MATQKFELTRYYKGLRREQVVDQWMQALASGRYTQGEKNLHRPMYTTPVGKISGHFCVYGVLCHALGLPARVVKTPQGLLFAYSGYKLYEKEPEPEFVTDRLPDDLHAFLVRPGRSKLRVDTAQMAAESPVLFQKILIDTELDRKTIMLMDPTIGKLGDIGVKFSTLALIVNSKFW